MLPCLEWPHVKLHCLELTSLTLFGISFPGIFKDGLAWNTWLKWPGIALPGIASCGIDLPGIAWFNFLDLPKIALQGIAICEIAWNCLAWNFLKLFCLEYLAEKAWNGLARIASCKMDLPGMAWFTLLYLPAIALPGIASNRLA